MKLKKSLSMLAAGLMLFSSLSGGLAESAAPETKQSSFTVIAADATTGQAELGYREGTTNILDMDGLKFKDLNGNGKLDVYEDYRVDTEDRITDLLSQMTLKEKSMLLYHICTCSDNSGVVFNEDSLYKQDGPYDERHYSM